MTAWKYEISLRVFNSAQYPVEHTKRVHISYSLYQLWRHCYLKKNVLDLKIYNVVLGGDGKQHNLALVQYVFDGTEREVKNKPRGNRKTVTATVVGNRKIRTALRTNQIAGFVTVPSWIKIKSFILESLHPLGRKNCIR